MNAGSRPDPVGQRRLQRIAAVAVLLTVSPLALVSVASSPVSRYDIARRTPLHTGPGWPQRRVQYGHQLVVARGEEVEAAICVLCSVRVEGTVTRDAVALWGDVTIASGAHVSDDHADIMAQGGRVVIESGANLNSMATVYAVGGEVLFGNSPSVDGVRISSRPNHYYPGQRTPGARGVVLFAVLVLLATLMGAMLVNEARSVRIGNVLRQPLRTLAVAMTTCLGAMLLFFFSAPMLYLSPVLWFVATVVLGELLWIALAMGTAGAARWIGERIKPTTPLGDVTIGSVVLIGLMIVPVIGVFVQFLLMLMAIGVGMRTIRVPKAS